VRTAGFLPPHLLERLGGLDLIARTVVAGFVAGEHRSAGRGAGEEFARHRPYQQGDDLRTLDWRLYARTDRLYVREHRAESHLQAYLAVDATLSMGYADGRGLTKARYAAYVAAALAHLMLRAGDQVGLASWGERAELHLAPRNRPGQLHDLLRVLERLPAAGASGAAAAVDAAASALRRRGRLVLISDLLEEDGGEALLESLSRLRARGDEVIVVRVLTPAELGEEAAGAGVLFDPERPERAVPAAHGADAGYRRRVAEYYAGLAGRMREKAIEPVLLSTAAPVERALAGWLRGRRT
jgi:uncharacterized protein (DUF58 family)